ncbi:MAG: glycosyltransferase family 4 protein [Bacteroidales bacterium]|nr:glycosyltransferase family 4 protein [Bacteroidales bacterium]
MNVLITMPCLLTGGTEIQTLNLVHALVQGGHEVTTACYFEHTYYMTDLYEKAGSKVVLFSQDGVRVGGLASVWFLTKHLWKLKRSLRPNVVHVQYMAPGAIPILLLWLMGQKNIVATTHTSADIYSKTGIRTIHFLQKHVLRAFVCITELAERSYFGTSVLFDKNGGRTISNGMLPRHSHFTIYNALPYGMCLTESRCPLNDGHTVALGVVSRLEAIKGMDLVVPAFAKVHERFPTTRLIVVGEGEQRGLMRRQATELNVAEHIAWAGRQPQSELHKWYGQMDIVLMPSRSEGFGLTAIEAMANGCVVVASRTGGLPEVVRDEETGLLHEKENVDDMVEKICWLVGDKALLDKMRCNLPAHVGQFTFERYSQSVNAIYKAI